jgi:hypothetical protein
LSAHRDEHSEWRDARRQQTQLHVDLSQGPAAAALYIQKDSLGKEKESNWLLAPDGPIYVVMRLYRPKENPPSILPAGKGPGSLRLSWLPPNDIRVMLTSTSHKTIEILKLQQILLRRKS